jgi:hypothetical protein
LHRKENRGNEQCGLNYPKFHGNLHLYNFEN